MREPPAANPSQAPEGVIGFAYALEAPDGDIVTAEALHALRGWRRVLQRLELLGQTQGRYGGLGYGNLSTRDPAEPAHFVITASQTSGTEDFGQQHLVRIVHANVARFWVDAVGQQPPSSESLTHAMIYQAAPDIGWVMHVHSPDIWRHSERLDLPVTPPEVGYGSAAMAEAVASLLGRHPRRPLVFATAGHEDGVFACGASADAAGNALVDVLAAALG